MSVSPNKFVEYLGLQYSTSPRFVLYQETSWYLHTPTDVFVCTRTRHKNNHATLSDT